MTVANLRALFQKPAGERWLAFLAVLTPLLFLYWPAICGIADFLYRDMNMVYLPVRSHFARRVLHGEFPQWYPFDGLGGSYVGSGISYVFHPTTLLHLVFPDAYALNLTVVLAHAMAAWGAYRLSRRWMCGRLAATVGAIGYCFSGYLVSMDGNIPYLLSAASMPWALFGLATASRGARWGICVCAVAMASIATAGEAQGLYFMSLILLALTMARPLKEWPRAFARLGAAGVLAVLLAGAQVVPGLFSPALMAEKLGGLEKLRVWAVHPFRLLEIVAPGPVLLSEGRVPGLLYGIPESLNSYWAELLFMGPSLVALGLSAVISRGGQGGRSRFLGVVCVLALFIVLGSSSGAPGFAVAQKIMPLWGKMAFRYPAKSFVFVALSMALLAGLGAQRVLHDAKGRKAWISLMAAQCALLVAVAVFMGCGSLAAALGWKAEGASFELLEELSQFQQGMLACAAKGLFIAVPLVLLSAPLRNKAPGRRGGALVLASVLLPMVIAAHPVVRRYAVPGTVLEKEPRALASIRSHVGGDETYGVVRSYALGGPRPFPRVYDAVETAHANVRYNLLSLRKGTHAIYGLEGAMGYIVQSSAGRFAAARDRLPTDFFLRAFNVGAAVVYVGPEPPELPRDIEDTYDAIFDDGAGARIRLAEPVPVSGTEEAVALAESGQVDPVTQVFVERSVKEDAPELPAFPGGRPVNPSVEVVEYAPERVVVDASSDEPCALFVADAFAQGWTATIDGRPVDIYPGDLSGRAVPFPAGRHRMEMTYRVPGQRVGLALSALGILALVAFLVVERRGHGRRHADEPSIQGQEPAPRA